MDLVTSWFIKPLKHCNIIPLKASNKLAVEFGACPLFSETKYAQGILPVDSYKKDIDDFCNTKLDLDWDSLRKDIKATGLRNSTLNSPYAL